MSTASEVEDGAAVRRWAGDARFESLVRRRRTDLLKVAVPLTGSRHGDDAVQEAVLAVGRSWTRVPAGAAEPVAYACLRRAVVRRCIDLRRRPSA